MSGESFLLLSLKESKSKRLAQIISNATSRKILDHMATKEHVTETSLAKELELPLSTVHYNLKALLDNKLISAEEYHYSSKGKEVLHYQLAKKYIIIAPADADSSFLEKIKKFLPPTIFVFAVAGVIHLVQNFTSKGATSLSASMAIGGAKMAVNTADAVAREAAVQQAVPIVAEAHSAVPSITLWFLIGAIVALTALFLWDWIRKKK